MLDSIATGYTGSMIYWHAGRPINNAAAIVATIVVSVLVGAAVVIVAFVIIAHTVPGIAKVRAPKDEQM
jgi:hypothetical protein